MPPNALRRRYPQPRVPRPAKIASVGVGVAVAMSWLIWAALAHSRPAVAAQVAAYTVISNTAIERDVHGGPPGPVRPGHLPGGRPGGDFQPVAEQQVAIEASTAHGWSTSRSC